MENNYTTRLLERLYPAERISLVKAATRKSNYYRDIANQLVSFDLERIDMSIIDSFEMPFCGDFTSYRTEGPYSLGGDMDGSNSVYEGI